MADEQAAHKYADVCLQVTKKHWIGLSKTLKKPEMWDICKEWEVDHKVKSYHAPSGVDQMVKALDSNRSITYDELQNWVLQEMLAAEGKPISGNKEELVVRLVLNGAKRPVAPRAQQRPTKPKIQKRPMKATRPNPNNQPKSTGVNSGKVINVFLNVVNQG